MKYKIIIKCLLLFFFIKSNYIVSQQVAPPVIHVSISHLKTSKENGVMKYRYNRWKKDLENKLLDGKYAIFLEKLVNSDISLLSYYDYIVDEGKFTKGNKNGFWKTMYKNKLVKTINYSNGLVIGKYRVYNTKGELLYKIAFGSKGNGKYKDYYYKTGILKEEGSYENGKKEGEWCTYDEQGNTSKIEHFQKGELIKKE